MPYKSLSLEQVEDRVGDSSMLKFNPLLWQKPPVTLSYGAAVLSVIAALIILRWMEIAFEVAAYVPLFLCAVMFSAWFGGLGPGLLAIAFSTLVFKYYFLAPSPRPLFFALSAFFVGSLTAAQRSAAETLRHARDNLQRINEALQAENTERRRAEDAVQKSESYLAEAQRLSHTGSFGWNVSTGEVFWSEETYRIAGYDRATNPTIELIFQRIHPEDIARVQQTLDRGVQGGTDLDFEHRFLMPDGSVKYVHVVAHAVRGETANLEYVGAVMEITAGKQAEEALQKAQSELAHVTRVTSLGEMTASIAHELNQPLAAIVNNASACLRWLAANNVEEARQSAALIRADGNRAGEIIKRIRDLAKKAPPQKDWIDINRIIREVIALARSEVERRGVTLETQLSDDVHYVPLIFADRIQLQQVILNLIMNAIEAMSEVSDGPRELLISTATEASGGIAVAVRDSGPGLAAENLDRLFTPFYTTKPQGMGMGLAICRSIIEAHGGRLWASVNDDRGATFQFTLPSGDSVV